jgi:hypothetical protein
VKPNPVYFVMVVRYVRKPAINSAEHLVLVTCSKL